MAEVTQDAGRPRVRCAACQVPLRLVIEPDGSTYAVGHRDDCAQAAEDSEPSAGEPRYCDDCGAALRVVIDREGEITRSGHASGCVSVAG